LLQNCHRHVTGSCVPSVAWFVDAFLPPRCVACGGPSTGLCSGCRSSLRPLRPPLCARCGAPTAWPVDRCRECAGRRIAFSSARAAFVYVGPAPYVVRGWKERGLRRLGPLVAGLVAERLTVPATDVITYILPDPTRQLKRSEHPAEALSTELGRLWNLPSRRLLARTRSTARQASLPRDRRRANAHGSFVAADAVPPRVVLVDDVYTTGSTASAAATALRAAGAVTVEVVTFARAVR
jgi:predicted amidophosphoribosyltransferase